MSNTLDFLNKLPHTQSKRKTECSTAEKKIARVLKKEQGTCRAMNLDVCNSAYENLYKYFRNGEYLLYRTYLLCNVIVCT